jgi:hypothetical protein
LGIVYSLRLSRGSSTLILERLDLSDRATHLFDAVRLFNVVCISLEPQIVLFALKFAQLSGQLIIGLRAKIFGASH